MIEWCGLYKMSEVYCDWCFFKIPLSPFAKGGTGKDLEWFQHNSCDKKGCRSAGFPPFKKRGARGDFGMDYIPSNRNIFMTKAIFQKERGQQTIRLSPPPHQIAVDIFKLN